MSALFALFVLFFPLLYVLVKENEKEHPTVTAARLASLKSAQKQDEDYFRLQCEKAARQDMSA